MGHSRVLFTYKLFKIKISLRLDMNLDPVVSKSV